MSEPTRGRGTGASPKIRQLPQAPPRAVGDPGTERALHQAREVDHGRLHPDPGQPRRSMDPERLDQLADSITAHGLLQPLAVRPAPWDEQGEAHYQIVAGGRRHAAIALALARCGDPALRARLSRVPVVIVASQEADIRVLQLLENLQREDLRPVEQARAFKELMDLRDLTAAGLAGILHISDQTVLDRVRLLGDPIIADAVQAGRLSIKAAGLAQKLADSGLEAVHARLEGGESLDVAAITRIRAELERQGIANPRGTRRAPRAASTPSASGDPDGSDSALEPNRLAISMQPNDAAPADGTRGDELASLYPPSHTPAGPAAPLGEGESDALRAVDPVSLPDLATDLALLADSDERTFGALLRLLDGAARRRLRFQEVRSLLVQRRQVRPALPAD